MAEVPCIRTAVAPGLYLRTLPVWQCTGLHVEMLVVCSDQQAVNFHGDLTNVCMLG